MSRKHNKDYKVDEVIRSLNKKSGVFISSSSPIIEIDKKHLDIGNGSKGKIDFLVNFHQFVISFK